MAGDRVQALVFGEVAEEYDRVRPGYPPELIADVVDYSAPEPNTLEIGAGTGKATLAFAALGARITALEPDPAMALVLRQRAAGLDVHIAMASLESYQPDEKYDLVYSAQAFHWTTAETRWTQVAAALRPGGALALFWNHDRVADPAVRRQVFAIIHEHVPAVAPAEEPPAPEDLIKNWPQTELGKRPEFGEFRQEIYRWERELPRADYLAYLTTQSSYRMLEDEERDELVEQLEAVLPERVVLDVVTLLYLARRV
jgi:SAM-dependent methyltransferase